MVSHNAQLYSQIQLNTSQLQLGHNRSAGYAMVKVIPRIRLRVKTPARATPRRPAKQKPRFRREATLNPPPDLTVSRVLLPQVQPCDIILEHKKFHLTKVELDPWT